MIDKKTIIGKMALTLWTVSVGMPLFAKDFIWFDGKEAVSCYVPKNVDPVVKIAAEMFSADMQAVTGMKAMAAKQEKNAVIKIVELDKASSATKSALRKQGIPVDEVSQKIDGFHISIKGNQIVIIGANGRGAAYGLLELSRKAGVSPWVWWGDVVPEKKQRLVIDDGFATLQGASVEYRGIFINDEDWSLRPWSYGNFEKADFGTIGPRTYKKIFQLLLRLRANAIWPGMHTGTKAFFNIPGAKAVADSCGIALGSSHCEPLLRNNVDEWDESKRGRFNYITNKAQVQDYWIERLKEVKGSKGGNLLTIGMRGIHDGSMEGVKTMQEKFDGLQQVINDQQELIRRYLGEPSKQTQVFIPYKEVLDIYNKGLKVPDYVTLMWCDDNYGYMTRLSDADEQKRSGGGGVYYHLSYWGRPHDYLWLATTQPGLIYNEMKAAYDHNVRKMWLVNVHDPKVAGYDLELFLDMAWNINSVKSNTINAHYQAWLCRQFGENVGRKLFPVMQEFYKLCGERRPEFMGWSQVEMDKKLYDRGLTPVRNSEFSTTAFGNEMDRYLDRYAGIASSVKSLSGEVRSELKDAFFAAIEYPVLAADAHARKILWAQKARSFANGSTREDMFANNAKIYHAVAQSQQAYQEIRDLTAYYNDKMADGKWQRSMNMRPRDLPLFAAPNVPTLLNDEQVKEWLQKPYDTQAHPLQSDGVIAHNACDYQKATDGVETVQMLGHSMNAVAVPKDGSLEYSFETTQEGDAMLRVALIPTQPNDKGDLRFSVSVDGAEPTVYSLKEPFRSERWKLNVLRGQAVRELKLAGLKTGTHSLVIKALDNHVIIDQWMVDYDWNRKYYLFPVASHKVSTPISQMEKLDRGVVALPAADKGIFVSWRLLGTDGKNVCFDVERDGKVIAHHLKLTNYIDRKGSAASSYRIITYQDEPMMDAPAEREVSKAVKPWKDLYRSMPINRPAGGVTPDGKSYEYTPNDCSVGDVDGDGEYEIILKWDPTNAHDNSHDGYTGEVIFDCYKLDGTQLWRINLGRNIRAGAHYTQFLVYDFDGDGKAEMICKTSAGSVDAKGRFVSDAATDAGIRELDNAADYRNSRGRILTGPELLTVFNGETGKAMHTIWYQPNRAFGTGRQVEEGEHLENGFPAYSSVWGDKNNYGNRGERYLAGVAFLEGADKHPSAVMCRGYYTRSYLWAVDFDGKELKTKWLHASITPNDWKVTDADGKVLKEAHGCKATAYAQGAHSLAVGDVDGDGCDEITYGSAAINHDGTLLYSTGLGHGDAQHLADLDPDRPGLEYYMVHEEYPYGSDLRDARTGEILFRTLDKDDTGRGVAADIDVQHRGYELWCSDAPVVRDIKGKSVSAESSLSSKQNHDADLFRSNEKTSFRAVSRMPAMNFRIYWDGDLQDELLANGRPPHFPPYLQKWNGSEAVALPLSNGKQLYEMGNSVSCNWSKATPNLQADLFGDWREEVIYWDESDASHLNIFTTNIPTEYRVPTLMHDHIYRMGVAWQNVGYNQPPHLGYYLPDHAEKIQK